MSREECAKRLGVTVRTLSNWAVYAAWFPRKGKKGTQWNLTAISKAMDSSGKESRPPVPEESVIAGPVGLSLQQRKLAAEVRRLEALAIQEELETAKEMGTLIPRVSAELAISLIGADVARYFQEQEDKTHQVPPDPISNQITHASIKGWLYEQNNAFQNSLAERLDSTLFELGEVVDLSVLTRCREQLPEEEARPDEGVGGTGIRKNPRKRKDKPD